MKRQLDTPVSLNEHSNSDEFHSKVDSEEHSLLPDSSESKAEKNRERNREHAKRTRQRKKEMIESMKLHLLELQREVR